MQEHKKRILISVAGHVGSGKSVVCERVKQATGLDVLSTGGILRGIAASRNLSPLQMNDYMRMDRQVDDEIDGYLKRLRKSDTSIILDSRMAWHFLPESLKVYLIVDPFVAAKRIFEAGRAEERYASIDKALEANLQRQNYEKERFNNLYNVTCDNWRNYDLILDTTTATPQQVADTILAALEVEERSGAPVCWLSPQRLIPTGAQNGDAAVAVSEGWLYIAGGEPHVSKALQQEEPALACALAAFEDTDAQSIASQADTARIQAWQDAHGFAFTNLPR